MDRRPYGQSDGDGLCPSISLSMTMVTKALLGDPMPHLAPYTKPLPSAIETVRDTIRSISPYWSCLKYGVKLPHDMTDLKKQMAMKFVDFIKKSTIGKCFERIHIYSLPQLWTYVHGGQIGQITLTLGLKIFAQGGLFME